MYFVGCKKICLCSHFEIWLFTDIFSLCRKGTLGQHSSSVFSREWSIGGLRVSSEGQSKNTEKHRTKLPLHRVNSFKSRISALELMIYYLNYGVNPDKDPVKCLDDLRRYK